MRTTTENWRRAKAARDAGDVRALVGLLDVSSPPGFVIWVLRALSLTRDPEAPREIIGFLSREQRDGPRNVSMKVLGQLGDHVALPVLAAEAHDSRRASRFGAVEGLGHLGGDAAVAHLVDLARSGDKLLRGKATEALAEAGGPAAIEALAQLTDDADFYVRRRAVLGLLAIGTPESAAALDECLPNIRSRRGRWWVRRRVRKLRRMGGS